MSDDICPPSGPCSKSYCGGCEQCFFEPLPAGTPAAGTPGECESSTCDGQGKRAPLPAGTPASSSVNGDCKLTICDGLGGVTVIPIDEPPASSDPCTVFHCANGEPVELPICPPPATCIMGVCSP